MSHFYKPGYRILDNATRPIRTIVDAGANIGDETVRFRHFHPNANIIAIEAEAENFRYLAKNMAADRQTACLHNGLWSRNCRLKLVRSDNNEAFSVEETNLDDKSYDIEAVSVLHLLETYAMQHIDILKLDIEGSEFELFTRDFEQWVTRVNVIIIECNDHERPGTMSAIFKNIGSEAFDCHINGENIVLIRRELGWSLTSTQYY